MPKPKIFIVGKEKFKKEYKNDLISRGYKIRNFGSLYTALHRLDERADLIILDRKQDSEPTFKEFLKLTRDIPKIIITDNDYIQGPMPWIKEPLTYPLSAPSEKYLGYFVNGLLREKETLLENKRLKSDLSVARRELGFHEEFCKIVSSSINLKDILPKIMKKVEEMTKAKSWTLLLVDEDTGELVFENAKGIKTQKSKLKIGQGIAGWVAKKGLPLLVKNPLQDKRCSAKIEKSIYSKITSLICVPIKSGGRLLGVLEIANKSTGDSFTKEDVDVVIKLVEHIAVAVERAYLHQKIEELTITDGLTKLFNTEYLKRSLDMEIERSSRYYTSVSLIFMDVDYFRKINARFSHVVGSKVLVEMGQLLLKNLRTVDVVARYGGDEFVIVLPQTPPTAAAQVAERIRRSIERKVFLQEEGYSLKITASFGVASFPESAKTKEELIKRADEAMYKIKNHSRNGVYALI